MDRTRAAPAGRRPFDVDTRWARFWIGGELFFLHGRRVTDDWSSLSPLPRQRNTHGQALQAKVDELILLANERARDLYIAEVHDVTGTGQTDKTYGRVFYKKGKSLISYAYDLDQETDLKNAGTFQAWGRLDKQQTLSLGVFYGDNASKKRWVLKFDDPNALATIDAVFVTAEPHGGSHHPSGKQLLFADLRVNSNHP